MEMDSSPIDYDHLCSVMGRGLTANAIRKLTPLITRPDIISLAAGAPSPEVFPKEELAEIADRVIREHGNTALQYGATRGNGALLEAITEDLANRGISAKCPSELVITTGSQQGLDLAARVLIDPGDIAFVELPSYVGGTIALHNAQAEMRGVRQDEGGIVIDDLKLALDRARSEGRKVKTVYTIPNFQNPSGVSLRLDRRAQLIVLADEYDFMIIEDDPYYELYFSGDSSEMRPLAADGFRRVIYMSSFSKVLAPGFRIAWLAAPEHLARKIELAKEGADLSSSQLDMAIVNEAMRSGLVSKRLPFLRDFYRQRCEEMLQALEQYATGCTWTHPRGGFFIQVDAPAGIDTSDLLPKAIDAGVAYVPGQPFFVDGTGANTMRLAFSKETPENIREGVSRLGKVLAGRTD